MIHLFIGRKSHIKVEAAPEIEMVLGRDPLNADESLLMMSTLQYFS